MATAVATGMANTATGPSIRQKRDMGQRRKNMVEELNIPIIKRKKKRS